MATFIQHHHVTLPNLIGSFEEIAQQVGGVPVAPIENFIQASSQSI